MNTVQARFDDIPLAMEYDIMLFDEKLKDIGWCISCVEMRSEDNMMLMKLKKKRK